MGPAQDQRIRFTAGLQEISRVFAVGIGMLAFMLLFSAVLLYLEARELAPDERLEKLAGDGLASFDLDLAVVMLTGLGLLLRYLIFHAPGLDLLLVSPLTEPQIFWAGFKRVLRPVLVVGAATCLLLWARLLGLGADVWLFVATAALCLSLLILLIATAALLALAGWLPCLLPVATAFAWSKWTDVSPHSGIDPDALANATAWHPVAFWLLVVAAAGALMLGLDHLLVRRFYSRDALIAQRDRPESWWLRLDEPSSEEHVGPGIGMGSGASWVRRLGAQTHALWRLVQRDEMPEAFARRFPYVLVWGAAWLAAAHWKLWGGIEPSFEDALMLGFGFVIAWVMALPQLAMPSAEPWASGRAPTQSPMAVQPLQEIFPVDPRAYTTAVLCCGTFLITLNVLLFLPFALLAPFPAGSVLPWLVALWVVAELFLGLILLQLSTRLDPRRPGFSWLRLATIIVAMVGSSLALAWFCFTILAENRAFLASCHQLIRDYPAASAGTVALVVALLELLAILVSLRRHKERWFDAAW